MIATALSALALLVIIGLAKLFVGIRNAEPMDDGE